MKILFLKKLENVANVGDIKNVSDGYATNFIIPKGYGVLATNDVQKHYEAQVRAKAKAEAELENQMKELAIKIETLTITIKGKIGTGNKLYGSITSADVAKELSSQIGYEIDKRKIEIPAIKEAGDYHGSIKLHKNVTAKIKISVVGGAN